MKLTRFLLARITEREVHARVSEDAAGVDECAALRRLLEFAETSLDPVDRGSVLCILASAYANHPDWQPEWQLAG